MHRTSSVSIVSALSAFFCVTAQGTTCPQYTDSPHSLNVSFTNAFDGPWSTPAINVTISNGNGIHNLDNAYVDTGGSGFILHYSYIPGFDPTNTSSLTRDCISFSSSGFAYSGFWYPVNITLYGKDGDGNDAQMISAVPVLAATQNCTSCAKGAQCDPLGFHIHWMGVGFGVTGDFQADSSDKNTFLSVTAYNGDPVDQSNFIAGYVMHNRSVEIGLNARNTDGFKYTKLNNTYFPSDLKYWDRVNASLSVNNESFIPGKALIDTGLDSFSVWSPGYHGPPIPVNGTTFDMRFDACDGTSTTVSYEFPDDRTTGLLPPPNAAHPEDCTVCYRCSNTTQSFVNPGQLFYHRYSTMFDAVNGWFGLKQVPTISEEKLLQSQEL